MILFLKFTHTLLFARCMLFALDIVCITPRGLGSIGGNFTVQIVTVIVPFHYM